MLSHPMFKWTHGQLLTYAAAAAVAAFVIGGGAGLWIGMRWQKGAQAIADIVEARNENTALRKQQRDQIQDLRTATDRLNTLSGEYEHDRQQLRRSIDENATVVAAFLADHPELRACDIGADGLRLWNDANRPTGTAAAHPGEPDPVVRPAAAGDGQHPAAAVDQSQPGDGDSERVRPALQETGAGSAGQGSAGAGALPAIDLAAIPRTKEETLAVLRELRGFRD